ncbi:hypothetical protein [Paenibacillus lemnae]|uniref:Uncharacterized protein n=1 Tax=Paenibacillus lemnae TaxID=1330551 RepID=A0A848M6N8_PAELE|nr:hypothetical protein [Paenibacillus lemnae]NMO95871.1 hypothetical protein [Paenibacillus lemnae]
MSVFRMDVVEHGTLDARYIQSNDLCISNIGSEPFDVLIHGYHPEGVFYLGLVHAAPGSTVTLPEITNHHRTFSLLLVTNINYSHTTGITIYAKDQGNLIAVFSNSHFSVME